MIGYFRRKLKRRIKDSFCNGIIAGLIAGGCIALTLSKVAEREWQTVGGEMFLIPTAIAFVILAYNHTLTEREEENDGRN